MKLKNCPFCGGKVTFDEDDSFILCEDCGFYYEIHDKQAEFKKWNARPQTGIQKLVKWVEIKDRDYSEIYKKIGELLEDE